MTRDEQIKELKKRLRFWQEEARKHTHEAGRVTRKANELEKEIYKLENEERYVKAKTA